MAERPDPELLWHYTNADGVRGIVQTGVLWATDAEYLNDSAELRYGREEVADALTREARRLDSLSTGDDVNSARAGIARSILAAMDWEHAPDEARTSGVYVACFCEQGDLLSQWRGYAAGSGYALAFRRADLNVGELCKVSYGRSTIPEMVTPIVDQIANTSPNHPGVVTDHYARDVIPKMLAEHKHPAFEEEREWRIIVDLPDTDYQPIKFRSGALGLIPYMELDVSSALAEVRVGPGPNDALRRKAVRRLLEVHRHWTEVTGSEAPFRP